MKNIQRLFYLCCLIGAAMSVKSQTVKPGSEVFEMLRLAESYRNSADLSFDVLIKYSDSLQTDSVVEQMTASYKLHGGLYYTYIDSIEIVQGNLYNVRVDHNDSVISISNRLQYPDVLNMPVTDTLYWKTYVQSITVTDVNDSTRTLKIKFKPGALYSSYEVRYSSDSYHLQLVKSYMPADSPGVDSGLFPSGKALISFTFSNYSVTPISGSWFSESKFVYSQGGQFQLKPAYAGYSIETNIAQ